MNRRDEETGEAIVLECELPDAPEKVWRALSEPELLAAWLMPNDFRAELGADFHFQPPPELESEAPIACKVLAIEPARELRLSWREGGASDAEVGSLSFVLTPTEAGGTRLVLIHRSAAAQRREEPRAAARHGNERAASDARAPAPGEQRVGKPATQACVGTLLHLPVRNRITGSKPPECLRWAA